VASLDRQAFPAHETYQFKGRYLSHRPAHRDDIAIVDRIRERFMKHMKTVFPVVPEGIVEAFTSKPAFALEFEVSEIFVQTPGPGSTECDTRFERLQKCRGRFVEESAISVCRTPSREVVRG
jgi:hypothetical protein